MAWINDPLKLYHGTTGTFADGILHSGIDLAKSKLRSDFGRGFYMTRNLDQAKSHANQVFRRLGALAASRHGATPNPVCAAVVEYEVDRLVLSKLSHLAFVSASADWMAFVQHCRRTGGPHIPASMTNYDLVYGPMAGLDGRPFPPDYEQLSLHTANAIQVFGTARAVKGIPYL